MPSLLKQLFDTLPLAGAAGRAFHMDGTALDDTAMNTMSRYVYFLEALAAMSVSVDCPKPTPDDLAQYNQGTAAAASEPLDSKEPVEPGYEEEKARKGGAVKPTELDPLKAERIPLWAYKTAPEPHRFIDIACRSRSENFHKFGVLTQAAWGVEGPDGLEPAIKVWFHGFEITLPLTAAARLLTFKVKAGHIVSAMHPLWPLHARHDDSVVHVFVYDVHPATLSKMALADPNHPDAADVASMLELVRRHFGMNKAESSGGTMGSDLFVDSLWPERIELSESLFKPGAMLDLFARPVRIIVAVSLTCCRENWQYAPASATGVARIYPQLFVKCHAGLDRVEATLHLDRPSSSSPLDGGGSCCDEMMDQMGSLLATDSNEGMEVMTGAVPFQSIQPYWSNLFAYYVPNFHHKHGGMSMRMVRNDRKHKREVVGLVYRSPVNMRLASLSGSLLGSEEEKNAWKVIKVPRQGAFDNIHMAPRMRLRHGTNLVVHEKSFPMGTPGRNQRVLAEAWGLRDVVMAPFCAHDCFHMHWRWSDNASDPWTRGWSSQGPYQVNGGTMIPKNQELDLRLRSDHQLSYIARAVGVAADRPVVFCHHGAGYALMAGKLVSGSRFGVDGGEAPYYEFESDEGVHTPQNSWALFYWMLRYQVQEDENGVLKAVERTRAIHLQADPRRKEQPGLLDV